MPDVADSKGSEKKPVRGLVFEVEGVAVDVRERMAAAVVAVLGDRAEGLSHGFFCRHLGVPIPETVTASVVSELGLRAAVRDSLQKALVAARNEALCGDGADLRPGFRSFLEKAMQQGLASAGVCSLDGEAAQAAFTKLGLDAVGAQAIPWKVEQRSGFAEAWGRAVRQMELPAGACVALVGSEDAGYGAIVAGCRCIGVPDRYTAHHDFGGADGVFDAPGEIDLCQVPGFGAA